MCVGCLGAALTVTVKTFSIEAIAEIQKYDLVTVSALIGKTNNSAVNIGNSQFEPKTLVYEKFASESYDAENRIYIGKLFFSINEDGSREAVDFKPLISKFVNEE